MRKVTHTAESAYFGPIIRKAAQCHQRHEIPIEETFTLQSPSVTLPETRTAALQGAIRNMGVS